MEEIVLLNYTLKVTKLDNRKTLVILNQEIKAKGFSEVIRKAEEILVLKKKEIGLFDEDMEIILQAAGSNDFHKMKWNKPIFGGENGYFKGWTFFLSGEIFEPKGYGFKHTHLIPIIFIIINTMMLLLSLYLIKNNNDYLLVVIFGVFMCGLVYSALLSLVRSNFNASVKKKKDIILFNIELELPIWIAVAITILNVVSRGIVSATGIGLWGIIIIVAFFLLVKIFLSTIFDIDRFNNNQQKG